MPRSQGDLAPRAYVVDDGSGDWIVSELVSDAPISAVYAQAFAARLREQVRASGMTINALGTSADLGVGRKTLERVLAGEVVPTFGAIARLERFFDADLWPGPQVRNRG